MNDNRHGQHLRCASRYLVPGASVGTSRAIPFLRSERSAHSRAMQCDPAQPVPGRGPGYYGETTNRALVSQARVVSDVRVAASHFRSDQIHQSNHFYSFLLHVYRVIHESLLVNEENGTARFQDYREDEQKMGLVFQQIVKTCREKETDYSVSVPRIS